MRVPYSVNQLAHIDASDLELFGMEMPVEDIRSIQALAVYAAETSAALAPRIVEVGSWTGRSALAILAAVPTATVYCVDAWCGSQSDETRHMAADITPQVLFETFCRNVRPWLFDRIIPVFGSSLWWAKQWPWKADMVFIDANHTYEATRDDIAAWGSLARVLAGHDYGIFPGVNRAVDELGDCGHADRSVWFRRGVL